MGEWFYVAVTFSLTWAVLGAYVVYLGRRTRRAEAALNAVEQANDLRAFR